MCGVQEIGAVRLSCYVLDKLITKFSMGTNYKGLSVYRRDPNSNGCNGYVTRDVELIVIKTG